MSTLYRVAIASFIVCFELAAPVAMVETNVTPISNAVPVEAMRRGFFRMFAFATFAEGPAKAARTPTPFIRTGSQKTAVTTMPRNVDAAPAMAIISVTEYWASSAAPPSADWIRHIDTAANAMPATISRTPIDARAMPPRRRSTVSIGRSASNGVTEVADRADPREASIVMMAPNAIGTANTCQEITSRMFWPVTPLAHNAHMSSTPRPTPNVDAMRPSTAASNNTDPCSWFFVAPTVRSRASVRLRCATSTWKVLAITRAATSMASTPKHIRNWVTTSAPLPSDLRFCSPACCFAISVKCFGSSRLTASRVFAATSLPFSDRSR